ncbi:ABC transporter permease [Bacteroidota bacterium]
MLKHYLKTAFRNLIKQKTYSIINVLGLALGMGCAILILLYVRDDLKFDKSHKNFNELYRVVAETTERGEKVNGVRNPIPIAPALQEEFPEILAVSRYDEIGTFFEVKYEEKVFNDNASVADSAFFSLFTYNFLEGNPATALSGPYDVVITKKMAEKYFGEEPALGKVLNIRETDFTVTGVVNNYNWDTHIYFDYIISYKYWFEEVGMPSNRWQTPGPGCTAYLLLNKGSDYQNLDNKMTDLVKKYDSETNIKLSLQPFSKIHLYSSYIRNDGANAIARNIKDVYLFSILGIFLIIIACINFMNLSTARSAAKSKEVGVRKVAGGTSKQLIIQFFGEAFLPILIAYIIAMLAVELLLPEFNRLILKDLKVDYLDFTLLFYLIILILFTTIVSGSYPALLLSRFKPEKVLRSYSKSGKKGASFRKILVVFQFAISVFLIIGTIVVNKQLNYVKNYNLGWNQRNLINVLVNDHLNPNWETIREELLSNPNIESVSKDASLPVFIAGPQTNYEWEGKTSDQNISIYRYECGYDYFETFQMEIIEGRSFSRNYVSDTSNFILNEEAVKVIGLQNPVGKRFSIGPIKGEIIGIVKNFHQTSLHNQIQPLAICMSQRGGYNLAIRIKPENTVKTVEFIRSIWDKYGPGTEIQMDDMEGWVENMYSKEQREKKIFNIFSVMAIFISCLGLFGMASFVAEQKSKEIGIRKTMGASITSIVIMLSVEFSKWVIIANIIAWPAAIFVMNRWLRNFEYKTSLSWWIFVLAAIIALVIALITVGFKTTKAARLNPVDAIRYD